MKIYNPIEVPVGNGTVLQPLPQKDIKEGDPFLLLHHAEKTYVEPGKGFYVGPHPHRGFQPVTFVFDGEVQHKDSLGNESIVKTNGVQWISAGSGLHHSEGMPESFRKTGGDFEMIQLWINLRSEHKMTMPTYVGASEDEMGKIETDHSTVFVVSGQINGVSGPVDNLTEAITAMVKSEGKDNLELSYLGNTKMVYVLSGKIKIEGKSFLGKQLVQLDNQDEIKIEIEEPSRLLILGGNKIKEPIRAYGPFVMNKQSEIIQALNDAHEGKMGFLPR